MDELTKKQEEETEVIDLRVLFSDLWRGFVKFWWVGVALALLFGGIQYYRQHVHYTPVYQASATFTVHMENAVLSNNSSGGTAYSFYYDLSMADQLATAFPYVVNNDILRSKVCTDLDVPAMPASVQASSVRGTNMITLTTTGRDPQMTYKTLLSVIDNYSSVADYIIGRSKLVMITEPEMPTAPSNELSWRMSVAKGILLGLLLGLCWIGVYALLRKTIRTKEDIRTELNQHCLGVLPQVTFKKYRTAIDTNVLITNPLVGRDFLEAFRLLRSAVQNRLKPGEKVLMVTSTAPAEGKSVTVVNLAAMYAKNGSRVLVIDCDLRNSGILPMLESEIEGENAKKAAEGEFYSIYDINSLKIQLLTFHTDNKKSQKIVRTPLLKEIVAGLRDKYDYILIDTPPCGMISDATIIAGAADATIYIVHQDAVMRDSIRSGLNLLLGMNKKVLGCVLTGATGGLGGYGNSYSYHGYHKYYRYGYRYGYHGYRYGYHGYRYGYGYGYGYGDKKSKKKEKTGRKEKKQGS